MRPSYLLPLAAAAALAGCNQTANTAGTNSNGVAPGETTMSGMTGDTNTMTSASGMNPAMGDRQFADTMAASDQFEIQSSQLAREKASRADVKEFASMLITDHTRSTADLKAAAGRASITPAPRMTAEQTSNLETLRATAAGAEFDRVYLTQQVPAHEQALATLQAYAQNGGNAEMKAFAAKTQGPVAMHLERARAMQR